MNWESEVDLEDTTSLRHVALACHIHLQELLRNEEAQEDAVKGREGYWASRQSAEFNLWCTKVGVYGEGLRAIDVRLKDAPGIFELLKQLLQSLKHDLEELQQPERAPKYVVDTHDGSDDTQSDSSSLSFMSLSSSGKSEAEGAIDDALLASENCHVVLRRHIEDTIDRLHELYRQKDGPKWAYEAYWELANRTAKSYFPSASEAFRQRIGESFARRRIRFKYLAEHQTKRAVGIATHQPQPSAAKIPWGSKDPDKPTHLSEIQEVKVSSQHVSHDQHTVYSATVNTKLDLQPQPRRQERAESVASVALRHSGFPPPPKLCDDSFHCPYCQLKFRAHEAGKERWIQHVIQDFEPYFCILEECKEPFDVPNSFDGLLDHLQSHLEERYHVDMPNGQHAEFDETEFENHLAQHREITTEMKSIMKDASRRKGPFLFESCPFCGGYPDIIEKSSSNSDTLEAQKALRKHIKQHMQDIAFFFPPYREDISNEDDDLKSSVVTGQSANFDNFEDPSEFLEICGKEDCDCRGQGRHIWDVLADESRNQDLEDTGTWTKITMPADPGHEDADFWAKLFPSSALYDQSPVPYEYYMGDKHLKKFLIALKPLFNLSGSAEDSRGRHPDTTSSLANPITITEEAVKAAAEISGNGKEMMKLQLDWRRDKVTPEKETVSTALTSEDIYGFLSDLYHRRKRHTGISEETVSTNAANFNKGVLPDRRESVVTSILDSDLSVSSRSSVLPRLPCEFSGYDDCEETFDSNSIDDWVQHIFSQHLLRERPRDCMCWVCDGVVFNAVDETVEEREHNYRARMHHIAYRYASGATTSEIRLDFHFLEHLRDIGLVSERDFQICKDWHEHPKPKGSINSEEPAPNARGQGVAVEVKYRRGREHRKLRRL